MRLILLFPTFLLGVTAAEIPQGTHVLLRLENSIGTRTAKTGDSVYLRTAFPIRVEGGPAIPVGSSVLGVVTRAQRSGRFHGRGGLEIGLKTLVLPTGSAISISTSEAVLDQPPATRRQRSIGPDPDGRALVAAGAGVLAGFGAAGLASVRSHDEDTVAGVGLAAGVAVGIVTTILLRDRDIEFPSGANVDVVFPQSVTLP